MATTTQGDVPMLLGLVSANESSEAHLVGLASAARARGWHCRCFLTDSGVKLLGSARLLELARGGAMELFVCEHSWEHLGGGATPEGATMGSQYQNAELAHKCDKVIVL